MFKPDDEVTVLMNPQCHGVVIHSDEQTTNIKINNFGTLTGVFPTSELKLREDKQ